ncbi:MAG: glycosyltransferase [Bacteroidia bacterium]
MKLLVLASRFPFPLEKGDKLRLYHHLRLLSRKHRICLVALHLDEIKEADKKEIESFCEEIHTFKLGRIGSLFALIKGVFSKKPWQVSLFHRRHIERSIKEISAQFKPDKVFCQLVRMAPYAAKIEAPVTLDIMDAFSLGMKRRAANSAWPLQLLFQEETRRLKRYEQQVLKDFEDCAIISQQDADALGAAIRIVPNGVDTEHFAPSTDHKQSHDLVFVGNMGYFPNVQASQCLVKEIVPLLEGAPRVLLAGARPSAAVKALANEQIELTGWVDDIREAYLSGKVFAAPLFTGSGQQNKILEAMALGIPCVTTSIVNNAIGARHGEHILVADSFTDFAACLERLLADSELRDTIGKAARRFVVKNYSWEQAVAGLI